MNRYLNYLLYETTGKSARDTVLDNIKSIQGDTAAGRKRTSRARLNLLLMLGKITICISVPLLTTHLSRLIKYLFMYLIQTMVAATATVLLIVLEKGFLKIAVWALILSMVKCYLYFCFSSHNSSIETHKVFIYVFDTDNGCSDCNSTTDSIGERILEDRSMSTYSVNGKMLFVLLFFFSQLIYRDSQSIYLCIWYRQWFFSLGIS